MILSVKKDYIKMIFEDYLAAIKKEYPMLSRTMAAQLSLKRLNHVLGTAKAAYQLSEGYGTNTMQAVTAAYFHDYFREVKKKDMLALATQYGVFVSPEEKKNPALLHGKVAAAYFEKENYITDPVVLNAIAYHTLGKRGIDDIGKIVYICDAIEETRDYPSVVSIRDFVVNHTLAESFLFTIKDLIIELVKDNQVVLFDTVDTYNEQVEDNK